MGLIDITTIPHASFEQQRCYRLIPSKFPPIALFEDVASPEDFEALYAVQRLTNPRIQDEIGDITLVPDDERVFNDVRGSGYIMATFTHTNPNGSRFSNGDYGVYYASTKIRTAIAETVYHREQFMRYTNEKRQEINMRCLLAKFSATLVDIRDDRYLTTALYDKDDYTVGQSLGMAVKKHSGNGITYQSVRREGESFALFKPNLLHSCIQAAHYGYIWDGKHISNVYKKVLLPINDRLEA